MIHEPDRAADALSLGSTAGGAAVQVAGDVRTCCLAIDGDAAYYLARSTGMHRVIGDAAPGPIAAAVLFDFFVVVGGVVLFEDNDELRAIDLATGTTTPLATFTPEIAGVTVVGGAVYVLTSVDTGTVTLSRVPLAGGPPAEGWSSAGTAFSPVDLTIDGPDLLFPVMDAPVTGYGAIVRVSTADGSSAVIAGDQPLPVSVAADATHVYWTDRGVGGDVDVDDLNRRGRVMRAPR